MSVKGFYPSPRWSGEILDCSMPLTFDTYSECSYRCLYCFAFFRKSISTGSDGYLSRESQPVDTRAVIDLFEGKRSSQFTPYIAKRLAMQWGGMADPFDENERKQGITLGLLRYFRGIKYPISFCSKAAWWTEDSRYTELFDGADHFNLKCSIVTADEEKARRVEVLAPSPAERLRAMERIARLGVSVTLRLRPYIIGLSDQTAVDLIRQAANAGAQAVSTEFMCLESRAVKARPRYAGMSKVLGFDVYEFYKRNTPGATGYMRLNRQIKAPYVEEMQAECDRLGLRFYVSDAHFKERCPNGSCCGLPESWNYSRGQFTQALVLAKRNGRVSWREIAEGLDYLEFPWPQATQFNTTSSEKRAKFHSFSMRDWMHYHWNNVNGANSPYKYFGGVLYPVGTDAEGDVIYEYRGD